MIRQSDRARTETVVDCRQLAECPGVRVGNIVEDQVDAGKLLDEQRQHASPVAQPQVPSAPQIERDRPADERPIGIAQEPPATPGPWGRPAA